MPIVEPLSVSRQLVAKTIANCLGVPIRVVNDYFGGRFACLKIAVGAVVISLLTTFPVYRNMSLDNDPAIWVLRLKTQHPLSAIPSNLKDIVVYGGAATHLDKLELRLTIPILGRLSGTGEWTILIWNHLAGLGVFYLLAHLASKAIGDSVSGGLFVLGLGPTFFGSWFFNDFHFGDGIAFFFLLLSIASSSLLLSCFSFLAAAFCDERCVAAIPLLFLYLLVSRQEAKALLVRQCIAIILGAGMWVVLRTWVASVFHLTMGTSMLANWDIVKSNLASGFPVAFISIFKASWTLPLFALLSLISLRKRAISAAFVTAFALALAPALLVVDFKRSVCYTFIILLVSVHFLWGDKEASRRYLAAILLANILLVSPATSVLRLAALL